MHKAPHFDRPKKILCEAWSHKVLVLSDLLAPPGISKQCNDEWPRPAGRPAGSASPTPAGAGATNSSDPARRKEYSIFMAMHPTLDLRLAIWGAMQSSCVTAKCIVDGMPNNTRDYL